MSASDEARKRYAGALLRLAWQARASADTVMAGEYPKYPQAEIDGLHEALVALLLSLAKAEAVQSEQPETRDRIP